MNKKLLRTSVIASVMAMAFTASAWAAEPQTILSGDRLELTDGVTLDSVTGADGKPDYTVDFRVGEVRAVRGVYDSYVNIAGDDGVVVGLQKHGSGKAIIIDENGQKKETGSFDTTNTTLFDLMNEYGNVGEFVKVNNDGTWEVTANAQGNGNRDGVGLNKGDDGKFETIIANYVGTPNFETNNLAIENAIRLDTSNSDRFGEGAAQRNKLDKYESTIFEANYDYFGVEHYTDTDGKETSATMKMDADGTNFTGQFYLGYDGGKIAINETNRPGIISGLKAGDVTSTSSDAINGAQLYEVINTGIVRKVNDHKWEVANNLNGLANNNSVTIQDTTLDVANSKIEFADGKLDITIIDTDKNKVSGSADIKKWADNNYAAKTVNIDGQTVNVTDQVVNNYNTIQNHETKIANNTTAITNINNNNLRKVTIDGDVLTFYQTIGGQDADVVYTDKHITGFSQTDVGAYGAQDAGKVTSTITTNFGQTYTDTIDISGYVSDAITNEAAKAKYDSNYTYNDNTIGGAIQNIQDNHVTYIQDAGVNQGGTHIWNVTQTKGGDSDYVTITDTKNKSLTMEWLYDQDADGNRFRGDYIQTTVTDTEGNKVSGWIGDIAKASLLGKMTDITDNADMHSNVRARAGIKNAHGENGITVASLVGEAYSEAYRKTRLMTDDSNLIVEEAQQLSRSNENTGTVYNVRMNRAVTHDSVTINNGPVINQDGINMNQKNITNLAPGEISANSTEAINGSQLWETNRNMDKLGGRLDKVGAGAAALAALHPMDFDPDDKLQFSAGVGNYKGETAAALGAFYRPTEKVMFSVAGTMGNGENMVNAGVTFALDRKNNVSNSRVAMAHEIKDLRDQVAALTALVSQIAGKGNPLLDTVMFPDVPENHWAYDYVENLQKRGIIEGYPDGNFGGDRSMTRYEYAAMLYRALEKGFPVDGRLLKEFEAELGRIRIDRIKGADDDANKVERVRVNDYEDRDDYGSKLAQVVADAAPAIEEEPAA